MTKKSFSTGILHGKVRILSCSYTVRDHIYIYIYIYIYIFINKTFFPQEITLFIPSFIPNDTDYAQPDAEGSCSSGFVKQGAINGAAPEPICGEY